MVRCDDQRLNSRGDIDPVGTHALVDAEIAGFKQGASAVLGDPAFARYDEGEQRRLAFGAANALGRARQRLIGGVDESDCVLAERAQPHGAGEGFVARRLGGRAHVDFDQMVADGVLPASHALRQRQARVVEMKVERVHAPILSSRKATNNASKDKNSRTLVQAEPSLLRDNATRRRSPIARILKRKHMHIAYLAVAAAVCLTMALIEAWLVLGRVSVKEGPLAWLLPNTKDLLSSHIDYLMMALFLFVFYGLFRVMGVAPPDWLVAAACFGSFFNPFGFLLRAMKPSYQQAPPKAFLAFMTTSCIATTASFAAAGWMIAAAAIGKP